MDGVILKMISSAPEAPDVAVTPTGATPGLKLIDARTLMGMTFPEPRWAVPGLLPEGLTILAGRPKMGKSWLALGLCLAVAHGGVALGRRDQRVQQGCVLYLALEDNRRRLQARIEQMTQGDDAPHSLEFSCEVPRFNEGGLPALEAWLNQHPDARLVVIDTLARFRPGAGPKGANNYEADYQVLGPLQHLAISRGVAIVVVTHLRKQESGEDVFDSVTGSLAITGAADATWVLTRERGKGDGCLHVTGRDVEERELALSFDSARGAWSIVGDAGEVRIEGTRRAIVEALAQEREPMTPKAIADTSGLKPDLVKQTVVRMRADGQLVRHGRGRYALAPHLSQPCHLVTGDLETAYQADSSGDRQADRNVTVSPVTCGDNNDEAPVTAATPPATLLSLPSVTPVTGVQDDEEEDMPA